MIICIGCAPANLRISQSGSIDKVALFPLQSKGLTREQIIGLESLIVKNIENMNFICVKPEEVSTSLENSDLKIVYSSILKDYLKNKNISENQLAKIYERLGADYIIIGEAEEKADSKGGIDLNINISSNRNNMKSKRVDESVGKLMELMTLYSVIK
jgi:hypothetical protein